VKTTVAVLAALVAVSVALDLPPLGPVFVPPVHRAPTRCNVPRTLGDAHDALGRLVAPELVRALSAKSEDDVRADDLRLGLWMREFWGLWNGGALRDHLVGLSVFHPDEMSELLLVTWWRHLNDRPLGVDEEVTRQKGRRFGGPVRPDPRCVCHGYGECQRQQYIRYLEGAVRAFALVDCCCGRRPHISEGVLHTAGLSEPAVFPYWPALRWEGSALCREVPFAAP